MQLYRPAFLWIDRVSPLDESAARHADKLTDVGIGQNTAMPRRIPDRPPEERARQTKNH